MTASFDPRCQDLLTCILPHVAFDGWSDEAFVAAAQDAELTVETARQICPRGAVELAIAYHKQGDEAMVAALGAADLSEMRFRDKIAHAIRLRLDAAEDKEVVRRGTVLFALPHMAPEGAKLIWGTADAIWSALGDSSEDVNWYTKRATLSAVYSSVVLYWLGDDSEDASATTAFIDRRIENVMAFEGLKAGLKKNPLSKPFAAAFEQMTSHIRAPKAGPSDLPGRWNGQR